jgi:hypothetical protein
MEELSTEKLFLTIPEMKALFIRFKKEEAILTATESALLLKIEKILYSSLSIREAENLIAAVTKN